MEIKKIKKLRRKNQQQEFLHNKGRRKKNIQRFSGMRKEVDSIKYEMGDVLKTKGTLKRL